MRKKNAEPFQRRRAGPVSLGADIRSLVSPLLHKGGLMQADLLSKWEDILGTALAGGVYPEKIMFKKGSGKNATLHVKAASGAYAMEFQARSLEIIERINVFFGYDAVSEIKMSQGVIPLMKKEKSRKKISVSEQRKQEIDALTKDISDENLKAALFDLGCHLEA